MFEQKSMEEENWNNRIEVSAKTVEVIERVAGMFEVTSETAAIENNRSIEV